jgi:hypothetical protein
MHAEKGWGHDRGCAVTHPGAEVQPVLSVCVCVIRSQLQQILLEVSPPSAAVVDGVVSALHASWDMRRATVLCTAAAFAWV